MNIENYDYFGSNNKMNRASLSQIMIHELGHAVLMMNNLKLGEKTWALGRESEVFASYIENRFLNERNLPLRSNYFAPNQGENFNKSSFLLNFNSLSNDNSNAIKNMQILINFKRSLQTIPNTDTFFK